MGRRTASRVLVVAGALLAILAILAVWVSRQALETDQWTETSSELLEDPAIQTAVAGFLVDQLYANVDVAAELRSALPEQARPLAGPAAGALRRAAEDVATRALDRPRVQAAWEQANRRAHEQLVQIVEGGGDVVSTEQGVVTLDLKALLDEIAERTGVGARAAERLPEQVASIEILRSDQLSAIQTGGEALKPLALVLVVLMLACFGGAIALARGRRRETLRACGIALVLAGLAALVVRRAAGEEVVGALASTASVEPAVESTWEIGTSLLVGVATATIVYGALAIVGAWLAGPTRVAVAARRGLAPYLRDARLTYGVLAGIVLIVLLWGPTEATRRVLPALALIALLALGVEALRRQVRAEYPDAQRGHGGFDVAALLARARGAAAPRGARPSPADGARVERVEGEDAVARLERLSELHRAGQLDDDEFSAAKHRVLGQS